MSLKHIAVLVSASRHPINGKPRNNRNDSLAMQFGLSLANTNSATMQVLHAGDANNIALQDYLALGANQIDVVSAAGNMIENLAEQLHNADLILMGSKAENAEDSGLLPYLLAAKLNLPLLASALEITPLKNQLEVLQFLPKGKRRRVLVTLPAIVAIHPLAPVELQFAHARQALGTINTLSTNVNSNNNVNNNAATTKPWHLETPRKPIKLAAQYKKTGHERLMDAISSKNKGGTVVIEGNSVEKAQVILNYLREHRLVDF
jgi:electron transfer flavoprotein beta subunit